LFWIAIGGLFFSLLCVSGALLRAALWPPPRQVRRAVETRAVAATAAAGGADDLETIEGIGPAIAALLRGQRIRTFAELAAYRPAELRRILRRDRDLARAEPSTWPLQARLLAEGRHGDFVRLIALLSCGVPRLINVDGIEECCAARLRAGGICTVAELQRSTVSRVVECFPQNDRAQVTRWAPRWIEHAHLLHEGDEAALCALAGIGRPSGQLRAEMRRTMARTASAAETVAAEAGLSAYWQRESRLRLLCAPLGGLALLLFLLLIALLGLIPSRPAPGPHIIVPVPGVTPVVIPGGGGAIWMIPGGWPPYYGPGGYGPGGYGPGGYWPGGYGQNGQYGQYGQNGYYGYGQYGPYGPYPPPYPPGPWGPWGPPAPGSCCPSCPQSACPPAPPAPQPPPQPAPQPQPQPQSCACDVCGCEAEDEPSAR
jgi:predicted flap endonuclease-1-like 5' DNA nuclease